MSTAAVERAPAKRKGRAEKRDAYEVVTARIVEALEAGVVPWHKPWKTGEGPRSLSTGKPYRGINVWTLAVTAQLRGYTSPYWVTFNQAKARGGTVRKGEKGTQVVLWKPVKKKTTDEEKRDYLLLRYYTVFNVEQCDGVDAPTVETAVEHCPIESAEAIASGYTAVEVRHGGDRAFYSPLLDYVQVPWMEQFDTAEHFYGTLFHELAHSTGHESRLARPSLVEPTGFGSDPYSKEELVAEMAAAFLCGEAGIDVNVEHHAGYIGHWLDVLKDDRKLLVQAAAAAQKASDLVLGVKWEKVASDDATSTTDVAQAA